MTMDDNARSDVSYWPLCKAAAKASLFAFVVQVGLSVYFAYQHGANVSFHLWRNILPYLRIETTDVAAFVSIVKWSSWCTAFAIVVFALVPFIKKARLQVQMGRSFGFISVSFIGVMQLVGWFLLEGQLRPEPWVYYMVWFGIVAFIFAAWFVYDEYRSRNSKSIYDESDLDKPEVEEVVFHEVS